MIAERARALLAPCTACPRACRVDRLRDERGVCGVGREPVVASAFPHHGEETCLAGSRGSGTIFLAGCNLACVFCQNWELSQFVEGTPVAPADLAELMLRLEGEGCHNVNLVSPSHVAPQVAIAIERARSRGLRVPVVYNSGGYDAAASLDLLAGLVDVYMPDFKVWEAATAERYCGAADYPERARAALRIMHAQVGDLALGDQGLAVRGLLVRHLVLPGLGTETAAILQWLARELSPATYVNLMTQYRPCHLVGTRDRAGHGAGRFPELARRPTAAELAAAATAALDAGLHRGEGCLR